MRDRWMLNVFGLGFRDFDYFFYLPGFWHRALLIELDVVPTVRLVRIGVRPRIRYSLIQVDSLRVRSYHVLASVFGRFAPTLTVCSKCSETIDLFHVDRSELRLGCLLLTVCQEVAVQHPVETAKIQDIVDLRLQRIPQMVLSPREIPGYCGAVGASCCQRLNVHRSYLQTQVLELAVVLH